MSRGLLDLGPCVARAGECLVAVRAAVAVLCTVILITGCTSSLDVKSVDGEFEGLSEALGRAAARSGVLRVITVHGIGNPGWSYSRALFRGIAERLDLVEDVDAVRYFRLDDAGAEARDARRSDDDRLGWLRVVTYRGLAEPDRKLLVYELDWSPSTQDPHRSYLSDDNADDASRPRVYLNDALKRDLINERLSDAILYAGRYRDIMQQPLMFTVGVALAEEDPSRDELAFVTQSLGSSMTLDTLAKLTGGGFAEKHPEITERVRATKRTASVFMLANPIPLLRLATFHPDEKPEPCPESCWDVNAIAISDPNDLLSYRIYPRLADDLRRMGGLTVHFVNVSVSIAKTAIFGLLANPLEAHTGHAATPWVVDLMTWGHPMATPYEAAHGPTETPRQGVAVPAR